MAKYEINRDNSTTKVKAQAKSDLTAVIMSALKAEYGEENVAMVRTGESTQTNEIGVIVGDVTKDGYEYDMCFTINPVSKEFEGRKTSKRVYPAFDFTEAKAEYEQYLDDKATKKAEAEAKKAQKIERDKKERERKKAEKEAQLSEEN